MAKRPAAMTASDSGSPQPIASSKELRAAHEKYAPKADGHIRQPLRLHPVNWKIFGALTLLGFITRLYYLSNPHYVVFDEVHFGKFGSYYLRREYFFDVHPPLGKLLVALAGWVANYDGSYLFNKIGEDYLTVLESGPVPYVTMRLFPAVMGFIHVPLAYLTAIELGGSNLAAIVACGLLLFDNAFVTQSRLILLDASLMVFIFWSMFSYAKFRNKDHVPFSFGWYFWLLQTGIGLGCAVSVKLVGLGIIATVGIHTVYELWCMYCDRANSLELVVRHFMWRALFLIVVPMSIFLLTFYIHFAVLINSGPGDSHMSAAFQSGLIGNSLNELNGNMPNEVAYGATITLRNSNSKPSCWLHSHPQRYPRYYGQGTSNERVSSAQQQVTCYAHSDHNNQFAILPFDFKNNLLNLVETKPNNETEPVLSMPPLEIEDVPRFVQDGDVVKLFHMSTRKLLNGHDVASPTQPSRQEVSCWNASEALAGQTGWKVHFIKGAVNGHWVPFKTHVRLEHATTKTILELSGEELPEWGFKQKEVVSSKMPLAMFDTWFVDNVTDARLPSQPVERLPVPGFFAKTTELLTAMLESNAKLTSKHVYASRPADWPFLSRGISFYHAKDMDAQIYLLGNVVSWWGAHIALVLFLFLALWMYMREARGVYDFSEDNRRRIQRGLWCTTLAWAIHYIPFFNMDRQLFLHHYLPAVYFVFLTAGLFADVAMSCLSQSKRIGVVCTILMAAMVVFVLFMPMTYSLPANGWEPYLKFRKGWDFKTFEK